MKLYSSCVQSRLLHNAGTSAYKQAELDKLDAGHRRRLRRALGALYPERTSSKETRSRANARPISIDVIEKRWTLLGHTLRLAKETTGSKVITQGFQSKAMGANEESQSEEDVRLPRYRDYYRETLERDSQRMRDGRV